MLLGQLTAFPHERVHPRSRVLRRLALHVTARRIAQRVDHGGHLSRRQPIDARLGGVLGAEFIVGNLIEAPVVFLLHLDRLGDQFLQSVLGRGAEAAPPALAGADHVVVADKSTGPTHRVERRLLAHAVPAAEARHQPVDDAGLHRVRNFTEPHDDGVGLPGFERGVFDRTHAAHLLAGEILGLRVAPLAAHAHAEAHVPDAEHLDRLPLVEPVHQHLVGLGLLERVHRADGRQHARADHGHRERINRCGLPDLHPGHLQVALAHGLEGLRNGIERAGVIEARLAAGDDLRQALAEVRHREARRVWRGRKVRGKTQHHLARLVLRVRRLGACRERGQCGHEDCGGGSRADSMNRATVHTSS